MGAGPVPDDAGVLGLGVVEGDGDVRGAGEGEGAVEEALIDYSVYVCVSGWVLYFFVLGQAGRAAAFHDNANHHRRGRTHF